MWRDDATLLDILRAAQLALEFRGRQDKGAFMTALKTQAAVLHELFVLGEAVKRLSTGFRDDNPGVPWKAVAGMRDRLLHDAPRELNAGDEVCLGQARLRFGVCSPGVSTNSDDRTARLAWALRPPISPRGR